MTNNATRAIRLEAYLSRCPAFPSLEYLVTFEMEHISFMEDLIYKKDGSCL